MTNENHREAPPLLPIDEPPVVELPAGVDRRAFMMRSALFGATAVITGCAAPTEQQIASAPPAPAAPTSAVSEDLNVVKKAKGPVMTPLDEFYKVGPGPSSSHTIGPMRITYDFYQRCTKLPADQLAKATGMKVHLFGSLSATGKGHGTERAALAGVIGREPATVEPEFLDSLSANPDQTFQVKLGDKTHTLSLEDIVYDSPKGSFPHPNTMTCRLMAGGTVLYELEYYSVGGGFIEWKGYEPPKKGQPKFPYSTMKELQAHAEQNKLSIARVVMANEMAVSGKSEAEINAFIDKVSGAMVNIVKAGLKAPAATLPGPIKLKTKAGDVYTRAMDDKYERQRGVGVVAAYALAGSEENARGHLVVTAPTGGSAGVMPALVYALGEGGRRLPQDKIRDGFLAAAAVGYLCKHNATLSGAEGGCQAEIGVASAMGAAFIAQAHDFGHQVVANAAESSLQHHLGMTCDPVAGFVQVPCIERCAFGAVKAWTGFMNPQSILCGMIAGLLFIPTTIFDMVWGVRFLQEARGFDYASAVMRSSMVPLGWIIGCPLLGFISDRIGRRKPVIAAGAIAMFGCLAWILYGRTDLFPPYVLGLVAGIASGAAMLPYTVIKEANPPGMSGTATGVVNFINFTFSALLGPVFGWLLVRLSGGASELSLEHYQAAFHPMLYGVALAIVFTFLLKETGPAARASSVPLPVAQREAT